MGVVDPRLTTYARSTRTILRLAVALGTLVAGFVVVQAWLIADIVAGAFHRHLSAVALRVPVLGLLAVVVARGLLSWGSELAAARASARAKSQLRRALVERAVAVGPGNLEREGTAGVAVLATRGIDDLDPYFSRYLPQLVLAVVVPVVVLVVIAGRDWVSGLIIGCTVPLVPVFMGLVGATTKEKTAAQLDTLRRLARHFLDVIAGLPTLKAFGRATAQVENIRRLSAQYSTTALASLRLSFLSSLILELVATVSVAMVAVAVGLRLLGGHLSFTTALFVLILAPEAYLPLRQLGANYHASADGLAATERMFGVLDLTVAASGGVTELPDPAQGPIVVRGLRVAYRGRSLPAICDLDLDVRPGEVVAIAGPSGCGKSTLFKVLLGFVQPDAGAITVGGMDLASFDMDAWRARIAWVPQRPHLFAGTLAENVTLGRPDADPVDLQQAVTDANLSALVERLPRGLSTVIGEEGHGLSAGERQRLALARAFLRDAPLLLLDEPTAALDGRAEDEVLGAVGRLVRGRTAIIAAHRPALGALCDRVIQLDEPAVVR
jgi:ATP-binding cassette, subfamily C, bacterial CydCD